MKAFDVVERVRRMKLRQDAVGTYGCIQEEAECRVGGRDKLEKATKRGLLQETYRCVSQALAFSSQKFLEKNKKKPLASKK